MMSWKLYEFIDSRGHNLLMEWLGDLPSKVRGRVNAKLDALANAEAGLLPNMITDTSEKSIREIVINSKNGAFRIFLCRGPMNPQKELTLICGGQEKDRKYVGTNPSDAEKYRQILIKNPGMRCEHE